MPTTLTRTETLGPTSDLSQPDTDLVDVALAASGDAHAFERLYRRHVNRIHTLVRRMLGEDADDVTQEIMVRAWQKLGSFRGESAFGTWLHRLAVNQILNHRSARGRRRRLFAEKPPADEPGAPGAAPGVAMDFETALLRLPAGARQIFVLHDVEGYRHEEIAGLLGISAGTSKSQLHYARMALRRHLG
ncbi:MAG TPA: RNA polymerase sigma factor [Gemmatimonadales bacterium]|jgi:RNA polymerase sigma-70 factor (ECF subfamily)|nr:RNA polymerase sigma factor [Gemmatimonadales bacterium]